MEDIAHKAGVSRSTVSRVINNHPNVSEKVRKRVREVIGDTGYTPNAAARTLASHRSGMIGLIYPKTVSSVFADPYYPRLTQGIVSACNQKNYTLNLFMAENRDEEENILSRALRTGFLDGMLVESGQIEDLLIQRLKHSDIPLVVMGRPYHSDRVSYVDIDNVDAARIAVSHLISLGYQRIGTITGPIDFVVGIDRLQGYMKALKENNIPVNESLIVNAKFGEEHGYLAMQRMLPEKPRAVFAASDLIALGAMRAVTEAGLRIPEDIAFVGFDDLPQINNPFPPLTTIRQPIYGMGIQLVETLLEMVEERSTKVRRIIMDTQLIVRQSCGAMKKE
ncbi:MAG: LacI family DNA-binding transcriptional regulator [Anaerolineales bacterium]